MRRQVTDPVDGNRRVVPGQSLGDNPVRFRLQGTLLGKPRAFDFPFEVRHAITRNAFVPRLWAGNTAFDERSAEVVKLFREFGILTDHTAFPATEGTDLLQRDAVLARAWEQFQNRAIATRAGVGAMNQAASTTFQPGQAQRNTDNRFHDAQMPRVSSASVQNVDDRAIFRRNNRWVDGRVPGSDKLLVKGPPAGKPIL